MWRTRRDVKKYEVVSYPGSDDDIQSDRIFHVTSQSCRTALPALCSVALDNKQNVPATNTRRRRKHKESMASNVPFLAVRPDDQFSSDIKVDDFATTNGVLPSSSAMDAAEARRVPPAMRLPAPIRFVLICLTSLGLNTFLFSVTADFLGYELASISRDVTGNWHVALLLGWKIGELIVAWYAGYDCKSHV
jgi:hypothetical protein